MSHWGLFLFLTLFCVFSQGFFSMFEMACVSFNKIRLQYYVSKKNKKAKWINSLLNNPSRFFGTTLLTVNLFLQMGSELSRIFYESIHLSPDIAPFTQIFVVLIFAELVPLFTARKHPENIAMFCVPVVFFLSKILAPCTWVIDKLNYVIHKLISSKRATALFLSREEIQKAFEEKMERELSFHASFDHFFSLRDKKASELMLPLDSCHVAPTHATVDEIKLLLKNSYLPFLPLYHGQKKNIVSVVYTKYLLHIEGKKKIIDAAQPPWFITENDLAFSILRQFQTNKQSVAIVLNKQGEAIGVLSLDQLIDKILGPSEEFFLEEVQHAFIEKTISGSLSIEELNILCNTKLEGKEGEKVSDYITRILGHHPVKGEALRIENLEFTVEEVSLFGAKTITVKTI